MQKFHPATKQHQLMKNLEEEAMRQFGSLFVRGQAAAASNSSSTAPRAGGQPDYSIETGDSPLDVERVVELEVVSAGSFREAKRFGLRF